MRTKESVWKIDRWVAGLRAELPRGLVIDKVSARMRIANDDDRYDLAMAFWLLLFEAERYAEVLQLLNKMIEEYPEDVQFPIRKATLYLYSLDDAEAALRSIDLALQRAYRTGFFRRRALGYKARILLELGRGEELSPILEDIMALRMTKGVPDVGRERDFVDRAPPGLIAEDVLARYNEFRPKRAGDTRANEPPEFEPPDDYE